MGGRRAGALAVQAVGVVLVVFGALAALLFLLVGLDRGDPLIGSVVLTVLSLLVVGVGAVLVWCGSGRGLASGAEVADRARAHVRPLMHAVCGLLTVTFTVTGVLLLLAGRGAESGAGVFLAFVPFLLSVIVLVEVGSRGGSEATQWIVVLSGVGAGGIVLLVVGITADDARQLVVYGVVCSLAASGAAGRAVSRRKP